MTDASGLPTATPVQNPETNTSPVESEPRNSTTRRPSLHQHVSSPLPDVAPVLGAAGWVGEPSEKAEHAATAFKHHVSPTVTQTGTNDSEKAHNEEVQPLEGNESPATTATKVGDEDTPRESDGEGDDEVVYPGGTQLALLTFGLCLATFTVALG
jgi:hypothetical protein